MTELKASASKRLKETYKPRNGILLPKMQRYVMRLNSGDTGERRHDVMHPSEMVKPDWCPRHDYYRMLNTEPDSDASANPSFVMENIFAEGHTIHGKYQDWLWGMGLLYGKFLCLGCGHMMYATSPLYCDQCKATRLAYRELDLFDKDHMIAGHTDGAIHGLEVGTEEEPEEEDLLIEIKSIGVGTLRFEAPALHQAYEDGMKAAEVWKQISRPFSSHMKQGQMYLFLSHGKYKRIVFIYESKFHQQTKEFVVTYNEKFIADILVEARDVAACIRQGRTPDRPYWLSSPDGKKCNSCAYRNTCWSIDAPRDQKKDDTPVVVQRTTASRRRKRLPKS